MRRTEDGRGAEEADDEADGDGDELLGNGEARAERGLDVVGRGGKVEQATVAETARQLCARCEMRLLGRRTFTHLEQDADDGDDKDRACERRRYKSRPKASLVTHLARACPTGWTGRRR